MSTEFRGNFGIGINLQYSVDLTAPDNKSARIRIDFDSGYHADVSVTDVSSYSGTLGDVQVQVYRYGETPFDETNSLLVKRGESGKSQEINFGSTSGYSLTGVLKSTHNAENFA